METLQPVGSLPCQRRDQAMKLSLLITVSAVLAGIVWFSVNVDERDHLTQLSSELQDKSIALVDSDSRPPQRQSSTQKSKSKSDNMPTEIQDLAERLNRSKGRALKAEIETFWHTCMSELNCEFKLNELATDLSAERFNLLENYHQLDGLWQQSVGNLLFDEQQPLASRVARLKSEARKIWGELAEVIFADEFALYDFSLQAEQLDAVSAQDYVKAFEDLITEWQGNENALGLDSNQTKYERAVALIPASMKGIERQTLIQELQKNYLSEQERKQIRTREQQIAKQKQQVRRYQTELKQLESRLATQRATSHASWSESDWQRYYQQEIANFRREFFAS